MSQNKSDSKAHNAEMNKGEEKVYDVQIPHYEAPKAHNAETEQE
jgi:hypothetical protein